MRYEPKTRWVVVKRPDVHVPRTQVPTELDLMQAVRWVKEHKPILWVGSVLSVPSGLPSGAAVTKALFDLIFPQDQMIDPRTGQPLVEDLRKIICSHFTLEELLDGLEHHGCDQADGLLSLLSEFDQKAVPNPLHRAVVKYYQMESASLPVCITTNWDGLLEKAFRAIGRSVRSYGPEDQWTPNSTEDDTLAIYHAHGSFESKNVVCSAIQQQGHIEFPVLDSTPILFLGYSGYEASMYPHLEQYPKQLWCIYDKSGDMSNPAKRRLMCRPDTLIYNGDLKCLLSEIGVLDEDVSLSSQNTIAPKHGLPNQPLLMLRKQLLANLHPGAAAQYALDHQLNSEHHPNTARAAWQVYKSIDRHLRNRDGNASLRLALLAMRECEFPWAIWTSLIASMLREGIEPTDPRIKYLTSQADSLGDGSNFLGVAMKGRYDAFRNFVDGKKTPLSEIWSYCVAGTFSDIGYSGELCELEGFSSLWNGDVDRARGYFDTAATYYYLSGCPRGGFAMEWASNNLDELQHRGKRGTMFIPPLHSP